MQVCRIRDTNQIRNTASTLTPANIRSGCNKFGPNRFRYNVLGTSCRASIENMAVVLYFMLLAIWSNSRAIIEFGHLFRRSLSTRIQGLSRSGRSKEQHTPTVSCHLSLYTPSLPFSIPHKEQIALLFWVRQPWKHSPRPLLDVRPRQGAGRMPHILSDYVLTSRMMPELQNPSKPLMRAVLGARIYDKT